MTSLDCLTWNIHRARGQDGRIDPARTLDALLALLAPDAPDLLVLTEADAEEAPYGGILDIDRLQRETGLRHAQSDPSMRWAPSSHGFLGTLVFHGPALQYLGGQVMDLPGRYPRGASCLTFSSADIRFRVIATHLSLAQPLRVAQMRTIGQYLDRAEPMPTLLIGDLNEWRPWGGLAFSHRLVGHAFHGPARRSFPSGRPILPLDRVFATAPAGVRSAQVISSPVLRRVSDHLPLRARVEIAQA